MFEKDINGNKFVSLYLSTSSLFIWIINFLFFFFLARYSKKINERQITLFFSRKKSEKDIYI